MITLLALSVNRQVEQDEYAVQYYVHTKSFGPLLEQGKHTTKVDTKFFIFPRTVYDLNIPTITCLSSDKIEIELTVDVQAVLRPNYIIPIILKQFQSLSKYHDWMKNYIKSLLIAKCLDYNVNEFYLSRSIIDSAMSDLLISTINTNATAFASTVEFFQLNNINLPTTLMSVVREKQNVEQEAITASNDRTNAVIQATTSLRESEQEALSTIQQAVSISNTTRYKARVQEQIIEDKYQNLAVAYGSVINNLNLNMDQFLEYLGAELYNKVDNSVIN